jgi:hypothetical protein
MYNLTPEELLSNQYTQTTWSLVDSLINYDEIELTRNIGAWQNAIKKWENWEKIIQKDHNIYLWYNTESKKTYSSDKLVQNKRNTELVAKFKNDPNYIFKNIIELLSRELLYKHIRSIEDFKDHDIKIYNTSDSDDIFWWVDCIVEISKDWEWNEESFWIDVAVTNNHEYLEKKSQKNQTFCLEYNLFKWKNPTEKMPRIVLQFKTEIMAKLVTEYLRLIWEWKFTNILNLYNDICEKKENENVYETLDAKTIIESTKAKTLNILNLN